jgi:hypothetical protein
VISNRIKNKPVLGSAHEKKRSDIFVGNPITVVVNCAEMCGKHKLAPQGIKPKE